MIKCRCQKKETPAYLCQQRRRDGLEVMKKIGKKYQSTKIEICSWDYNW